MKFYHEDIEIDVPKNIYYPREDTRLFIKVLEEQELEGKKILEIGCGSGILSIIAAKKGATVTATDLNIEAIKTASANAAANKAKIRFVESDMFQHVAGNFDIIFFNPPYLPDEKSNYECFRETETHGEDRTYWGGKTGREVVEKFIMSVSRFLKPEGRVLLLISSVTGEKETLALFHKNDFRTEILRRQKIPWEELIVIEATPQ